MDMGNGWGMGNDMGKWEMGNDRELMHKPLCFLPPV